MLQRRVEEFKQKLTEEGEAIVVEENKGRSLRDKVGGEIYTLERNGNEVKEKYRRRELCNKSKGL